MTGTVFLVNRNVLGTASTSRLAARDVNGDGDIAGVTDAFVLVTHQFIGTVAMPSPFPESGILEWKIGWRSDSDKYETSWISLSPSLIMTT